MITAHSFAGKHYAVYGLARSGLATVEALLASGAKVTAWDAKEEARSSLRAKLVGRGTSEAGGRVEIVSASYPSTNPSAGNGSPPHAQHGEELEIANLDEIDLGQFDSLVVTPGLPLNRHPIANRARDAGVEIIGDIELFARARPELPPHKVVGITGTNGKSTTTALVHHILRTAGVPVTMGGNIGLPILAQDPLPEGGIYVLELSSYQIDLTHSLDCDVAVLLNITPDHLDRYESFEAYRDSKLRLFRMQSGNHEGVIGARQSDIEDIRLEWIDGPRSWFLGPPLGEQELWPEQVNWPALQGVHNAQNVGAAQGAIIGLATTDPPTVVTHAQMWGALETFPGLSHRMERIRERQGVTFVNDSKATNATATAPALAAFDRIRWICGGRAKTDSLDECAPHFGHVRKAYAIGEAGELFARLLSPHMAVAECGTLERAVGQASSEAERGDTVLLSPACASFDQFKDFEDRGNQFRALVEGL